MELHEKVNENAGKEEEDHRCYVRIFCDNTSLHGARFLNDKNLFIRVIWLVLLGLAFTFCGYRIYWALYLFYEKPFSTTITRERVKELEFPAVTICNLNAISKRQYAKVARANGANQTEQELEREIQLTLSFMNMWHDGAGNLSPEIRQLRQQMNNSEHYNKRGNWMKWSLSNYAHRIEDMLSLDWLEPCKWRGVECSAENFTAFVNIKQGSCFTFNSGKQGHPRLNTSIPGATNGLRLRLNVEEKDHVSSHQSIVAGFKISIDHQDYYPMVEELGFGLQPGTHTFAALRKKKFKNLPWPYRTNCSSPDVPFSKAFNFKYSVYTCLSQCVLDNIIASCHCQPLLQINPGIEVCSIKETFYCVYPILLARQPERVTECCSICNEPCEYSRYDVQLSYASAVSHSFTRSVPPDMVAKAKSEELEEFQSMSVRERQEFLRSNIVSLDVYFDEIAFDLIEQNPTISSTELLGTIGGYLGLFLGMSLLTVLEFVDFVLILIYKKFLANKTTRVHHIN